MTFDQLLELIKTIAAALGYLVGAVSIAYARASNKNAKAVREQTSGTQDWQNKVLGRVVRLEALIGGRGPGKRRHTAALPKIGQETDEDDPW